MRNHVLAVSLACVLLLAFNPPAHAQAGADSLWAKAVAMCEANASWVPGSMYMHMQEVDKHGEPKDDRGQEVWTRLFLSEDGEVDSELVKALDNGEDITEEEKAKREKEEAEREEERKEAEKEQGEREESGGKDTEKKQAGSEQAEGEEADEEGGDNYEFQVRGYDPFDPGHQEGLRIKATGEEELIYGRRCAVYEFLDERKKENRDHDEEEWKAMGKVWLEVDTGAPCKLEYTTDPLPKRVKKMDTTVFYEFSPPDTLFAKNVSIRASGGFLFIKKYFHMNMTFSDYWRMPREEEEEEEQRGVGEKGE